MTYTDTLKLVRRLEKQQFRVVLTRNCHYKVYPPNGGQFIVMASTPSDGRAMANVRARLRKAGFKE